MAMMAITTSSSISVKPRIRRSNLRNVMGSPPEKHRRSDQEPSGAAHPARDGPGYNSSMREGEDDSQAENSRKSHEVENSPGGVNEGPVRTDSFSWCTPRSPAEPRRVRGAS